MYVVPSYYAIQCARYVSITGWEVMKLWLNENTEVSYDTSLTAFYLTERLERRWHGYTIGTVDVLQAYDAGADMGMTYTVIVQCTDCVVFP